MTTRTQGKQQTATNCPPQLASMIGNSVVSVGDPSIGSPIRCAATPPEIAPTVTANTKVSTPVPGPNRHGRTGIWPSRPQPDPTKRTAATPPASMVQSGTPVARFAVSVGAIVDCAAIVAPQTSP